MPLWRHVQDRHPRIPAAARLRAEEADLDGTIGDGDTLWGVVRGRVTGARQEHVHRRAAERAGGMAVAGEALDARKVKGVAARRGDVRGAGQPGQADGAVVHSKACLFYLLRCRNSRQCEISQKPFNSVVGAREVDAQCQRRADRVGDELTDGRAIR